MTKPLRHGHITRDIKPRGECKACDAAWKIMDEYERNARISKDA